MHGVKNTMSILNLISGGVDNNGGVVLKGGNTSNTQNYTDMLSLVGNYQLDGYPMGSTPVQNSDVTRSIANGYVFAYHGSSRPLIKGFTALINNGSINHDLGSTGTADPSLITGIHYITFNRNRQDATAMRENKYNEFTGKFEEGYPQVTEDRFGTDFAATVSRANTGSMRFVLGLVPTKQNYLPKTG